MKTKMCPVCNETATTKTLNLYIGCKNCGCLYLQKMPPDTYLEKELQEIGASIAADTTDKKLSQTFQKRLEDLSAYIPPKSKILDIGCGNGIFIDVAKRSGYTSEGMDVAVECVKQLKTRGITAYTDISKVPDNTYDAITLFDVIEHVPHPADFLATIRKKLKKNGVVMVTTPNTQGLIAKAFPNILTTTYKEYSDHLVLFSIPSLSWVLKKTDFSPLSKSTDTIMVWCYSKHVLYRKIVNKIIYLLISPIKTFLFKKNLGDNIQIIARMRS